MEKDTKSKFLGQVVRNEVSFHLICVLTFCIRWQFNVIRNHPISATESFLHLLINDENTLYVLLTISKDFKLYSR